MKRINIKVYDNDEKTPIMTLHPLYEAKKAKSNCDKLFESTDENWTLTVFTVSTDAVAVYCYYGKDTLGLDVHLYLNDKETDIESVFESFNKSLDFIDEIAKMNEE